MAKTVAEVESVMRAHDIGAPLRMTAAASDGARVIAFRYSSDHASPSLYYIRGESLSRRIGRGAEGAVLVLSEPLDEATDEWIEVAEAQMLIAHDGEVTLTPITPYSGTAA